MGKRLVEGILASILLVSWCSSWAYWSSYERLEWGSRSADTFYCLDIFDENWQMLKQAVVCGEGLHQYFPRDLTLPTGKYHWKVWSPSITATYHEQQLGFEGEFNVPDSYSDERRIIWPTRDNDSFYCLDIFNFDTGEMERQAVACGENLHSYSPAKLDLPVNRYRSIAWSPSVQNYPNYSEESKAFWGYFEPAATPISTDTTLQWNYRGEDELYCLDIFDKDWNFLHQAVACGEGLHQFSPHNLNLAPGEYHWKVWSPSVQNYQEYQPKLEGSFTTEECGLPYRSDEYWVQWGCRNKDLLYCIDIYAEDGKPIAKPYHCEENLHKFSPRMLDNLGVTDAGTYRWKVWSPSITNYDEPQPGFEGEFYFEPPKPMTPDMKISWEVLDKHTLLDVYVDEAGILWLGSASGLEKWQMDPTQKLLAEWHWTSGGFPANGVSSITPGANNSLWLATDQGLLNFRDGQIQTHFTPDNSPLPIRNIQKVAADGLGGIWMILSMPSFQQLVEANFMHFDGFGQWQTAADIPQTILDKHGNAKITALASDGQGGLWVGLQTPLCYMRCPYDDIGGVLHYVKGNWSVLNEEHDDIPNSINALAMDHQQNILWIGFNYRQLGYFDSQHWEEVSSVPVPDFLAVNSLATTSSSIWIGFSDPSYTSNSGPINSRKISHYDNNQWHNFSLDEPFPLPYPNQIAGLGDKVWVGGASSKSSLSYFNGNSWQHITDPSFVYDASDIEVEINTGNVWAVWNGTNLVRQTNQGVWEKLPYLIPSTDRYDNQPSISEILPTTGNGLWVKSLDKLVYIDGHGHWQDIATPDGRPAYEIKLANDKHGGLWMASVGKLSYYNPFGSNEEHSFPNDLSDERVSYLYHDGKKVWMGMQTVVTFENANNPPPFKLKLISFENGQWQVFDLKQMLQDKDHTIGDNANMAFLSIISDNAGGVWMSFDKLGGLFHFDGQRLSIQTPYLTNITDLYSDGYGQLWAASNNGLIRMRFE